MLECEGPSYTVIFLKINVSQKNIQRPWVLKLTERFYFEMRPLGKTGWDDVSLLSTWDIEPEPVQIVVDLNHVWAKRNT